MARTWYPAVASERASGRYVVVRDPGSRYGFTFIQDRESGRCVARARPGNTRFATTPLVIDDRLFVIDDGGEVAAFAVGGGAGR